MALAPACDEGTDPAPDDSVLDLPDTPFSYSGVQLPAHFQSSLDAQRDNTPADNPITDAGATLGRVLFYDPLLSQNETVSCASCHAQATAFSDTLALSDGFAGEKTGRNTMPTTDARFYKDGKFFWDERAATLEQQVLMPIQNEKEMGMTLDAVVARVSAADYYAPLFEAAFGDRAVTSDRVSKALAQFVRSIVSYRSRYDEGVAAAGAVEADFANFSAEENHGKALFLGKAGCAACHLDDGPPPPVGVPPTARTNKAFFFIDIPTNNGLPRLAGADATDEGVGGITGAPPDDRRFKAPSLRNVGLTAPYMHDGRFGDLAAVIEHYDSGVEDQPTLDRRLREPGMGPPRRLHLTPAEKSALVAFLRTLDDTALVSDPMFSDPFRR
ncbi:MAG: cytochrome c peroxidase [Polyangiaceae bacterium]